MAMVDWVSVSDALICCADTDCEAGKMLEIAVVGRCMDTALVLAGSCDVLVPVGANVDDLPMFLPLCR